MMSANCSVVVSLSRVGRPCRTQCCSAKCLISTCFNRPGPRRVAMPMHADASSFKQAVMVYPSSLKKFASPQELTRTNSCRVKLTFTTAQSSWFLRSRPATHAPPSINRPPVSVFRRGLPTIHHTSQPTPSTVLGAEPIPDSFFSFSWNLVVEARVRLKAP